MDKRFYWATTIALILSFAVILLGAYTRLSDAGLGCPDWPGCYGKLVVAKTLNHSIDIKKAWTEMAHRYIAGILGLLIFILAGWRMAKTKKFLFVPSALIFAVIFQVVLGMWTVTLKVWPLVVVAHLFGGLLIAGLLCWLRLNVKPTLSIDTKNYSPLTPWVMLGLFILLFQIFLGAWTSTNYAALACPNFPYCTDRFLPPLQWREAFHLLMPIGPNYEGGQLTLPARMTIHFAHRLGALLTVAFWLPFALYLAATKTYIRLRPWAWLILILLALQCVLGVLNVVKKLPMSIALSHNGVAALLFISVVAFLHKLTRRPAS